ncbi:conserved hypothetical protein [Arthrobacter sp. 9AX]|uniref:hypothetical protein n=1 Tax=Arthrobacter sp. 9AX TaxID=2653131 RepID=UPI0012F1EA4D|nr:hypothetical protein [Arthrobacter sp. 9AX]VXB72735.1 conserved hypothetical protein [Arthrobacter sp. 9AX]
MTPIESVAVTAQATFGRDGAMFEGLLGFVAQLSLVLWSVVVFTVIVRFVGIRIYRRSSARSARAKAAAAGAAVPAIALSTTPVPAMSTSVLPITAAMDLVQPSGGGLAGATELVDVLNADAGMNGRFDELRQPAQAQAAVAASIKAPRRMSRIWRFGPRSAAHVPALAANSTEG